MVDDETLNNKIDAKGSEEATEKPELLEPSRTTPTKGGYQRGSETILKPGVSKKRYLEALEQRISETEAECNPFEIDFARFYATSGNKGQAAKAAGSTAKAPHRVGSNTLAREPVQRLVALIRKKAADMAVLDVEELISKARTVYDNAMKAEKYKEALDANRQLMDIYGVGNKETGNMSAPKNPPTLTEEGNSIIEEDLEDTMRSMAKGLKGLN